MNCHVCDRNNAFDLSICPSCGAMMNDTVRAELSPKVSISKPLPLIEMKESFPPASGKLIQPPDAFGKVESGRTTLDSKALSAPLPQPQVETKTTTADIAAKPTNPTLVEFHSKKSSVPEWRLQLQNVVRQRQDRENAPPEIFDAPAIVAPRKTKFATSGANALKIECAQAEKPVPLKNPTLNSALARIEKSRQKFFVEEESPITPLAADVAAPHPASKNFPFYIASKQTEITDAKPLEQSKSAVESVKPKLAEAAFWLDRDESGGLDTNKLPPPSTINQPTALPAKISTSFTKTAIETPKVVLNDDEKFEVKSVEVKEIAAGNVEQDEAAEDCAPFALRFNAGLFDLIIGAFLSLFLLSPFMLSGGEVSWLSVNGVLAFLATCSIVMFIYLTTTVGFYGRTFGMRLFSLEIVDIEGENYPTLHQAAVSAAVYLLSLAFGGAGFLTLLFNEDRRAAHDLISGTIVVKEI